ncbi:MAG: ABC transporter ATP-binding protein, partial [Roseibium sp.]|nr:ABC transporter ATP-binding protein [Roseibium sp.]
FTAPRHPYTMKLVDATPRSGVSVRELLLPEQRTPLPELKKGDDPLLEVRELTKTYQGKSGPIHAVKGVSFKVNKGQSIGLVGESGCGKSTTSSILARLLDPTGGEVLFKGEDLAETPARAFSRDPRRSSIQMVFQDATDSFNPRHTARQIIGEPLARLSPLMRTQRRARIEELASQVGLPLKLLDRFPHQLSGGQKARVGIARAIALNPELLILDEPTAALDVSIQAVVLNLLVDLRAQLGLSFLFVSHDLHVVRLLCDEVIVMKEGQIVEAGATEHVMTSPAHPHTQTLLSAAPQPPILAEPASSAAE